MSAPDEPLRDRMIPAEMAPFTPEMEEAHRRAEAEVWLAAFRARHAAEHPARMAYIDGIMRKFHEDGEVLRQCRPPGKPALWRRVVRAITDWLRGEE